MQLTSFTDYGLRMLMVMASAPLRVFSTAELAEGLGLSRHHLTKIMQQLAQGGIVSTRRGSGGGAVLALPPEQIKLGAVVRILESGRALVECLGARDCNCTLLPQCRLKARLRAAQERFYADLDNTTLAELALPFNTTRAA